MAETRTAPVSTGPKQDVVVTGKALNDATGTIAVTYSPGPGDPQETEIFGKKVKAGESVDVPNRPGLEQKIRGNPYLSMNGEKKPSPLAQAEIQEQDEATFEDNVARERSDEYLNGRPVFANAGPGEAERVARAQQAAAELNAAKDDDDADRPRRGRPRKDA